jgi:2-C-methyl-D-erythritol 4-phosphate cytidylyltransferase
MNSAQISNSLHVLIPCAGSGTRMGLNMPKQFERLAGKPMILHAVDTFLNMPEIETVWIGVSGEAKEMPSVKWPSNQKLSIRETGGATRHQTVLNTLKAMIDAGVPGNDWVLVHDAARPGLTAEAARRLIKAVIDQSSISGGILAMPMADTLKIASGKNSQYIDKTLPRDGLWLAQTPQMFHLQVLRDVLDGAIVKKLDVTDESSAMELAGYEPLLVHGEWQNLKVTYPQDWALMSDLLSLKKLL